MFFTFFLFGAGNFLSLIDRVRVWLVNFCKMAKIFNTRVNCWENNGQMVTLWEIITKKTSNINLLNGKYSNDYLMRLISYRYYSTQSKNKFFQFQNTENICTNPNNKNHNYLTYTLAALVMTTQRRSKHPHKDLR